MSVFNRWDFRHKQRNQFEKQVMRCYACALQSVFEEPEFIGLGNAADALRFISLALNNAPVKP